MYVFHYDPETLAYTGNSPVDFCQLNPGTVLVPAWASKNPPPTGWDSRIERPFYVPGRDAWEIRALPPPPAEPPPPTPAEKLEQAEALKLTLEAHLRAASDLIETLKGCV